jgi:hypothetical protein
LFLFFFFFEKLPAFTIIIIFSHRLIYVARRNDCLSLPNLQAQASVFISPRGRMAQLYPQAPGTHFSRLLRHSWVTVGLFFFPGHHTECEILLMTDVCLKEI